MTNESTKKLAQLIENYLTKNELGISDLAAASNVSATTIRRILSHEQKPKRSTFVGILEVICNSEEASNLLAKYFDQDLCIQYSSDHTNLPSKKYLIRGGMYYEVAAFLISDRGRTSAEIKSMFGTRGLGILEDMVNGGAVETINSRYKYIDSNILPTPDQYKTIESAAKYESMKTEHKNFLVSYGLHGVSKQGLAELKAFYIEAQEKPFKIVQRHEGAIPVHFGLFCSEIFVEEKK